MSGSDSVEVTQAEVQEGMIQGMLQSAAAYIGEGQINTQQELAEALQNAQQAMVQKYGVELGKEGWVDATHRLATLSIEQGWDTSKVADVVEPMAREFAPEGSMAAMVLRNSPPDVAAQQLLSLVEQEVPHDVQSLIVDVLGILKKRL
jgi:hypothetical protein